MVVWCKDTAVAWRQEKSKHAGRAKRITAALSEGEVK